MGDKGLWNWLVRVFMTVSGLVHHARFLWRCWIPQSGHFNGERDNKSSQTMKFRSSRVAQLFRQTQGEFHFQHPKTSHFARWKISPFFPAPTQENDQSSEMSSCGSCSCCRRKVNFVESGSNRTCAAATKLGVVGAGGRGYLVANYPRLVSGL